MLLAGGLALLLAPCSSVHVPDVAWRKAFDFAPSESHPHAGVETHDGGFLMCGDGLDYTHANPAIKRYVYMLKTDAHGNEEWRLTLGTVGWNYGKFCVQLDDRSFILSGAFTAVVDEAQVLHRGLVHVSATGTLLQGPILLPVQTSGKQEGFTGIAVAEDGALVATGFYNAWPGYPDQAMFLVYGETGLTKFVQDKENGQWNVAFDVLVNTTAHPDILGAAEGMRVLYDQKEQVYAVSHTVQMKDGLSGTFEFGMTTFTLDGKQKWTRAFPSKSGKWTGSIASHPYALSFGKDGSYAIGGLAVNPPDTHGRLVSIATTGDLLFDQRFHGLPDYNVECYGVQPTHDGGYILTCGYGVKTKNYPNETDVDLTWRALVHRTDSGGEQLWQAAYGNRSTHLSNAGEYIIATRDGGYAVYVDSKEWGNPALGGSFGLLRLMPDGSDTSAA
jgi:hypothetical protein